MSEVVTHTKGPWEVRKEDGTYRIHAPDIISHGFTLEMRIAENIGGCNYQRGDGSWDESEKLANGRLIAESPVLLALIEEAIEYGLVGGSEWGDRARAAIAKAKGEMA